jgi:hypothetical protein
MAVPLQPLVLGHQSTRPESTAIGTRGSGETGLSLGNAVTVLAHGEEQEANAADEQDSLYEAQHHRPRSRGMGVASGFGSDGDD